MRLLVLNYGSATLKYALFEGEERRQKEKLPCEEEEALVEQLDLILASLSPPPEAVVHRVVHGGPISEPCLIDDAILEEITRACRYSPVHNRRAVIGIERCRELSIPQVAVFDTAFHATLPERAKLYALPFQFYLDGIRRFGFHGISYAYLLEETATLLGKPRREVNAILLHLGGGASICAVEGGRSVETSMGMTPLEGLVMDRRSGDLDPGIAIALAREFGPKALERLLSEQAGLFGLTGTTDVPAILERAKGEERCRLALDLYVHRIRKYLGAYFAVLEGRVEAVVFSGGIGENCPAIRERVCTGLEFLGLRLDPERNRKNLREISPPGSLPRLFVIPTDEELQMARTAQKLLSQGVDHPPQGPPDSA